jgi:hypothetical protein
LLQYPLKPYDCAVDRSVPDDSGPFAHCLALYRSRLDRGLLVSRLVVDGAVDALLGELRQAAGSTGKESTFGPGRGVGGTIGCADV